MKRRGIKLGDRVRLVLVPAYGELETVTATGLVVRGNENYSLVVVRLDATGAEVAAGAGELERAQ